MYLKISPKISGSLRVSINHSLKLSGIHGSILQSTPGEGPGNVPGGLFQVRDTQGSKSSTGPAGKSHTELQTVPAFKSYREDTLALQTAILEDLSWSQSYRPSVHPAPLPAEGLCLPLFSGAPISPQAPLPPPTDAVILGSRCKKISLVQPS